MSKKKSHVSESLRSDYREAKKDCEAAYSMLFKEMRTDDRFYAGDQIEESTKQELIDQGRPPFVTNMCKKPVDLMVGYEQQNRSGIKVNPVELATQQHADVLTEAIKWNSSKTNRHYQTSRAFFNACVKGVGWLSISLDTLADPFYGGNIMAVSESPFCVLPEPSTRQADLSDAAYILTRKYAHKRALCVAYPEYAKEIMSMKQKGEDDSIYAPATEKKMERKTDSLLSIDEMWYRTFEKMTMAVDAQTGQTTIVEQFNRQRGEQITRMNPNISFVEHTVPVIMLYSVIGNSLEVYDGKSPFKMKYYPYVPIFSTFIPDTDEVDWMWKVMGMIRVLRDPQNELNKRRIQLLATTLEQPFSGFFVETGTVEDEDELTRKSGPGRIIHYRRKKPEVIPPPTFPAALAELAGMDIRDIKTLGPTDEMMGIRNESRQAGIVMQQRTQQGLVIAQSMFENLSHAKRMLGNIDVELMSNHWTMEKFNNICETEIPPDFDAMRKQAIFDCIVDETANSSTYRMAVFTQVMEALKMFPGTPELLELAIDYSEIPVAGKEKIKSGVQRMMQQQANPAPSGQPQQGP